jgi:hypothetical protein
MEGCVDLVAFGSCLQALFITAVNEGKEVRSDDERLCMTRERNNKTRVSRKQIMGWAEGESPVQQ